MAFLGRSKDPQKALQDALRAGDHEKAVPIYEALLANDPDNQQMRLRYADSLAAVGHKQKAVRTYQAVAEEMASTGFLIKGIAVFKKIVAIDPSREDLVRELAEMNHAREAGVDYKPAAEREAEPPPGEPEAAAEPPAEEPQPAEPAQERAAVAEEGVAPEETAASREEAATEEAAAPEGTPAAEEEAVPREAAASERIAAGEEDDLDDALEGLTRPGEAPAPEKTRSGATAAGAAPSGASKEKIPLFSEFSTEEFAKVVAALRHYFYPEGEVVVKEGDPGDSLFVVVQGEVGVTTRGPDGKEVELARLGEGEFFGEVSLLSGKPRTATITALRETEVMELGREDFDAITQSHPGVRETLQRFWKERTDRTVETMVAALQGDE